MQSNYIGGNVLSNFMYVFKAAVNLICLVMVFLSLSWHYLLSSFFSTEICNSQPHPRVHAVAPI